MASTLPQQRAASSLPSPSDRPDADVVIYDGQCNFCRANAAIFARLDRAGRLAFISLHDEEVQQRWPDLSHEQLMQEMVIVDRHGKRHVGAASIRYLSRRIPLMWPLAPLLHIPFSMPMWAWLYRQIARRRYWIGGKRIECDDDSCKVHYR
jgi:predicted DCC family thiol-disulfide oxidoreductase YuxK